MNERGRDRQRERETEREERGRVREGGFVGTCRRKLVGSAELNPDPVKYTTRNGPPSFSGGEFKFEFESEKFASAGIETVVCRKTGVRVCLHHMV